ncbi:MAG: rod shape-determining protein MreC [Planctomycetota bacterium]|jgi:cell shape-determining protein MreC
MRFSRIDRFLLVLAALFVLAALRGRSLPGEEVLPDLYGSLVQRPLRAGTANLGASPAREEEDLKSRVASLEREVRQLQEQVASTRELAGYFDKLEWPEPARAVGAWVTAYDPDPWQRTFRIGSGSNSGIRVGGVRVGGVHQPEKLAVVSGSVLLGVVIRSSQREATVRRVDDDRFALEVEVESPAGVLPGVVKGRGDQMLSLHFVRLVRELKAGTPVFTSSFDRDIPPGLLVGRIEKATDTEGDGVVEVSVRPAAGFVRLGQVDVLIPRSAEGRRR